MHTHVVQVCIGQSVLKVAKDDQFELSVCVVELIDKSKDYLFEVAR